MDVFHSLWACVCLRFLNEWIIESLFLTRLCWFACRGSIDNLWHKIADKMFLFEATCLCVLHQRIDQFTSCGSSKSIKMECRGLILWFSCIAVACKYSHMWTIWCFHSHILFVYFCECQPATWLLQMNLNSIRKQMTASWTQQHFCR